MSADPAVIQLLITVVQALQDGRLETHEVSGILAELVDVLDGPTDGGVPALLEDLGEWVRDLLHRDREELIAAAVKHEAKGHDQRAARLRERAERR